MPITCRHLCFFRRHVRPGRGLGRGCLLGNDGSTNSSGLPLMTDRHALIRSTVLPSDRTMNRALLRMTIAIGSGLLAVALVVEACRSCVVVADAVAGPAATVPGGARRAAGGFVPPGCLGCACPVCLLPAGESRAAFSPDPHATAVAVTPFALGAGAASAVGHPQQFDSA